MAGRRLRFVRKFGKREHTHARTLRPMSDEVHYCIYCGSEGPRGTLCASHSHCRGFCNMRPTWSMGLGTFMGRRLAYVSFPWVGDLDAPYVAAPERWPSKHKCGLAFEYVERNIPEED